MRLCLAGLLFVAAMPAQQATIQGIVTDRTGASIPGAKVTATSIATGVVLEASTNPEGHYTIAFVTPGTYTVRAEKDGFSTITQENIKLDVGQTARLDFTLEVGAITQSIDVAASSTLIDSQTTVVGQVISNRQIVELPLNGRNPLELQYLVAGAGARTSRDQAQNGGVSINGSRANSNNYQLDNGDNHDPYFNSPAIFPSPDA